MSFVPNVCAPSRLCQGNGEKGKETTNSILKFSHFYFQCMSALCLYHSVSQTPLWTQTAKSIRYQVNTVPVSLTQILYTGKRGLCADVCREQKMLYSGVKSLSFLSTMIGDCISHLQNICLSDCCSQSHMSAWQQEQRKWERNGVLDLCSLIKRGQVGHSWPFRRNWN